jgi:hypothetical protein
MGEQRIERSDRDYPAIRPDRWAMAAADCLHALGDLASLRHRRPPT